MEEKFYLVQTKFGHVGRNYYVIKTLPIKALNGKEAAKKARMTPRVKHHLKDAIIEVTKVDYEEYMEVLEAMKSDMYFKVCNVQEQRKLTDIEDQRIKMFEFGYKKPKLTKEQKREKEQIWKYKTQKRKLLESW